MRVKLVDKESKKKSVNYFVFKFNPESSHRWKIKDGYSYFKKGKPEDWTSPIPDNPAPKKGDKIIIWETGKYEIKGIAEVKGEKRRKNGEKGWFISLNYINFFENNPYDENDAMKDNTSSCFKEMKGNNDKRSKKIIDKKFHPEKLYNLLMERTEFQDFSGYKIYSKTNKLIGDTGENIVFNNEKEGLIKIGKKSLAEKLKDVSKENIGYDILSFEKDGSKKYIEVKSTTASVNSEFYITKNENKFLTDNENTWLYMVTNIDIKKKTGEIKKRIKYKDLKKDYEFSPEVFKVKKK